MTGAGRTLTALDPEPPPGTLVRDDCGVEWVNDGYRPCCWVQADAEVHDPESWTKVAGNYGPVTVIEWGDEDCPVHDTPMTDGVCSSCLADSAHSDWSGSGGE